MSKTPIEEVEKPSADNTLNEKSTNGVIICTDDNEVKPASIDTPKESSQSIEIDNTRNTHNTAESLQVSNDDTRIRQDNSENNTEKDQVSTTKDQATIEIQGSNEDKASIGNQISNGDQLSKQDKKSNKEQASKEDQVMSKEQESAKVKNSTTDNELAQLLTRSLVLTHGETPAELGECLTRSLPPFCESTLSLPVCPARYLKIEYTEQVLVRIQTK